MHDQENLIPEHGLVLRDMVTGLNKNGPHFPALAQRSLEVTGEFYGLLVRECLLLWSLYF